MYTQQQKPGEEESGAFKCYALFDMNAQTNSKRVFFGSELFIGVRAFKWKFARARSINKYLLRVKLIIFASICLHYIFYEAHKMAHLYLQIEHT